MTTPIFVLLILLSGCKAPCFEKAAVIGPSTFEAVRIQCTEVGAVITQQETSHGLILTCSCPKEPTP